MDSADQLGPDLRRSGPIHDDSDAGGRHAVASIAFATAVVNLRHVFYGLSLLDRLHSAGWKKWLIAFLLTDETYSLITTEKKDAPIDRLVLIALFDYSWWISEV